MFYNLLSVMRNILSTIFWATRVNKLKLKLTAEVESNKYLKMICKNKAKFAVMIALLLARIKPMMFLFVLLILIAYWVATSNSDKPSCCK